MDFSGCSSDVTFGPTVRGCRGDFDFTLKFEKIVLSIIPASIFIAISLTRGLWLIRKPPIVRGLVLQSIKVATIAIYAALQLSLLVLSSTEAGRLTAFFISASALELVAALCMAALSFLEHSRSPRPSILLNAYLFVTILLDIAQTRSLWLAAVNVPDEIFARVFTVGVAIKAAVILLESQHKSKWLQWDAKDHSPEETSGLYGLGGFFWLNELFMRGYKKLLTHDDLFPLDASMASKGLQQRLEAQLQAQPTAGRKFGLVMALAKALAVPLLLPVAPRIALLGFTFCQPFLINSVLSYLEQPAPEKSPNTGYGLIGATIIIYTGIAVSTAFYYYFQERALWMARGALASMIYKKTTQAKISAADDSAALTLMSTDIERIRMGFMALHDFWAALVAVGLASWLLERELGPAFVAPIIVVILCMLVMAFVARLSGPRQKSWMEQIQKRVGLTSSVVANMKHLKISGLTAPVETLIQKLRVDEISAGSRWRATMNVAAVISFTPAFVAPIFTFAFTVKMLNVTTIFTSLSYLLLLTNPLSQIFQFVPSLLAAFACLARIQAFLEQDPREDFRESGLTSSPAKRQRQVGGDGEKKSSAALTITRGSFGWERGRMSLKDLELDFLSSHLTIVIGPIASGKSTLCKVLLGETPVAEGRVTLGQGSRRVGYCDQVPFLSNASIRENIVGFSPFDAARYNEVVEATALLPDLAVLPRGDKTKVGSNGITLSGGQKQRVSMARALYLETDLLIFDDILSGLDADTEEQVFQKVFGPDGLLRRRNATAVLCTHSVRHLPSADHIIALATDGTIVEKGTFEDLVANEKYVQSLGVKAVERRSGSTTPVPSADVAIEDALPLGRAQTATSTSIMSSHVDDKNRQVGDSTVYKHYAQTIKPWTQISFLLCGITIGFFYNFPQIWLNYWSADVMAPHRAHPGPYWVGIYALLQVVGLACLGVACALCLIVIIAQSGAVLHRRALHTVISAPLSLFTETDAGVITNLFSQDMTLIDTELPMSLLNMMMEAFIAVGMAAVVATSSPYIGIGYPFLIAILWGIQRFYLRTSRQLRLLDLEAKSPLYTHFTDTIKGVATFRAFGWVDDSLVLNRQLLDNSQRPAYLLAMIQLWLTFTLNMIVAAMATLVVVLATQVRMSTGTGFTGASLVTLMSFGDYVAHLIMMYTMLETSIGAVSRLKTFSEKVAPEDLPGEDIEPPMSWPTEGEIEIKGVSASYGTEEKEAGDASDTNDGDDNDLALKNLDISIRAGEKVAICGRSGSGKSSTILLLLRLLDPLHSCAENMSIDGVPLHRVDRSTLRRRVIAVPQDAVFLPDGTAFKANLDPFGVSTDAECRAVLETVDLWGFVEERGGLAAGMSADTLSQGQKQLFSLARAILRRRVRRCSRDAAAEAGGGYAGEKEMGGGAQGGGLLLLDEVSSSVDKDTDRAMQGIIQREFAGYTIVMVSHRLDMVMDFDKVLVMDKGSIVEAGHPRQLVKEEGSRFRELWAVGNQG